MSIKGTVRKNSIMHKVAEAVLTHPEKSFTARKIWESLNNDYPDIKIGAVSHCLTKSGGPVSKLCNKTNLKEGMASIFERISVAAMPAVHKSKSRSKTKSKKIEHIIPDTVTDYQIGQSIILYIDHLRNKIKELATAFGDMQAQHKNRMSLTTTTFAQKNDTIKKLQKELTSLRQKTQSTSRTFRMDEIANLK